MCLMNVECLIQCITVIYIFFFFFCNLLSKKLFQNPSYNLICKFLCVLLVSSFCSGFFYLFLYELLFLICFLSNQLHKSHEIIYDNVSENQEYSLQLYKQVFVFYFIN